jgi:hypothetical protein
MAIDNKWNNCLIVEDDIIWKNFDNGYPILEKLIQNNYDVLLLGGTYVHYNKDNYKLIQCSAASSYLIKNHYYTTLLANFEEGLDLLLKTNDIPTYALDIYWRKLQIQHNWYIVAPSMCIQRDDYSDIQKKKVEYADVYI